MINWVWNWLIEEKYDTSNRQNIDQTKLRWYLWNMQTSAMNWNLSLKADRLVKSPECCIFLASTAISLNSFFIALCQSNISSIGCVPVVSETSIIDSECFLFPVVVDSQAQFTFSTWWVNDLELHWTWEWFTQVSIVLMLLLPSIQEKTTFNKQEYNKIKIYYSYISNQMNINNRTRPGYETDE